MRGNDGSSVKMFVFKIRKKKKNFKERKWTIIYESSRYTSFDTVRDRDKPVSRAVWVCVSRWPSTSKVFLCWLFLFGQQQALVFLYMNYATTWLMDLFFGWHLWPQKKHGRDYRLVVGRECLSLSLFAPRWIVYVPFWALVVVSTWGRIYIYILITLTT